jgi:uncharacterized protein (DUF1778 family)
VGEGMTEPPGLRAGWPGYFSRDRRSLLISQGAGTGGAHRWGDVHVGALVGPRVSLFLTDSPVSSSLQEQQIRLLTCQCIALSDTVLLTEVTVSRSSTKGGRARNRAIGRRRVKAAKDANLLVRFDRGAKVLVQRAAHLRGSTVSDYVRSKILALAKQDIEEASFGVLRLPKADQIAFWRALQDPSAPTEAQKKVGRLVRSVM